MKVVFKFAIAFFLASCVCLGLYSAVLAGREAARLERLVTDDLLEDGALLQRAFELAWREQGVDAARGLLRAYNEWPGAKVSFLELEEDRVPDTQVTATPRDAMLSLSATFPVRAPDGRRGGALRLDREVARGIALIKDELGAELLAVFALAVAMAAIATVLGGLLIGRPLDRIVQQARRIGAGDLSQRLPEIPRDEIGALKRELNTMCDRLAQAYVRLEEEAASRAATLEQLRHLDRLRTVGTIASSIAHELGTPLNILLLRGQSLASGDIAPADVADSGKAVVSQVEKMSAIVRGLLDFARARKRAPANLAEVDVSEVVKHACRLLGGVAKKQRVELVVRATPDLRVRGDATQLEQALTNLIVNAIQAMPGGGKALVSVKAAEDGGHEMAVIEIVDEGDGFDEEMRSRIFEPFFTTKPSGAGTGLGLHVARGIAEDHGGTLSASSTPGGGSTFSLTLPRIG